MSEPEPKVDLHVHSNFSDGELSPEQLLEEAQWAGLSAIALTDHDNIDGLARARSAGAERSIEIVAGVELSCVHDGTEAHILGLCIEAEDNLQIELRRMRDNRQARMAQMLERLAELGVDICMEELPLDNTMSLGRPHLARMLMKKGYVRSISEAFERYIGDDGPAYVAKERWSAREGIELIHAAGGLSFLAHPGASGLVEFVEEFVALGIDGLEVHYPKHSPAIERQLLADCERYGLLLCGGSDFHAKGLGTNLGTPYIPYEVLRRIKQRKEDRNGGLSK